MLRRRLLAPRCMGVARARWHATFVFSFSSMRIARPRWLAPTCTLGASSEHVLAAIVQRAILILQYTSSHTAVYVFSYWYICICVCADTSICEEDAFCLLPPMSPILTTYIYY